MLDVLSQGFRKAAERFQGKTTLSEENIAQAVEDIRVSLLEADVEYKVATNFIARVKEKALGEEVKLKAKSGGQKLRVTPGDHFTKICKEELEALMGPVDAEIKFASNTVTVIMMVGLQGSGKTTTSGKLAKYLKERKKKKPLLVGADIYRPAAAKQLEVLAQKIHAQSFHIPGASAVEICKKAKQKAIEDGCDVVILDTAGRLSIDKELMAELSDIKKATNPDEIFFVCDAMMGQDAVTTAKSFHDQLGLSGFIITKLDGDARGGAALSIKEVTGKPIKFLGMGEDLGSLEVFRPEGLASRILGLGDVVGLMEDFERVAGDEVEEDAMRMLSGKFNFKDFYKQINMIQKMGPLKDLIAKMPMQNMIPKDAVVDEKELIKIKSMIDSMTEKERLVPDYIDVNRARRIAKGSGRKVQDVSELLKKFKSMRQMMNSLNKNFGGLMGKIPGLKNFTGGAGAGAGAMPSMNQMASLMNDGPGAGGSSALSPLRKIDRDKVKKAKKSAKENRKKNRKR